MPRLPIAIRLNMPVGEYPAGTVLVADGVVRAAGHYFYTVRGLLIGPHDAKEV